MFKTANNDGISRPNSRPKLPFPGNGKGNWKSHSRFTGREQDLENATGREGNGKFEACNPGNPGNHIKSKVKFKIWFIFMPWPAKLKIIMVFPVLIPGQNFLFPGTGNLKLPWEGKFEACIPGNHGKREFPLTPVTGALWWNNGIWPTWCTISTLYSYLLVSGKPAESSRNTDR